MRIGISLECDYRIGNTQQQAFDETFAMVDEAEKLGFDNVWLAERHFAPPLMTTGIPSFVSSPLILATSIAARTSRIRVGIGVLVLPLGHPVRLAEEVATLDNVSQGRLDLGIGRSGFTRAYEGYGVPYAESRDMFQEHLEIMRRCWTEERFDYKSERYELKNVAVVPRPYQRPFPPLWAAATTRDTFPLHGRNGHNVVTGLRGMSISDLVGSVHAYRDAWKEAGHPGEGQMMLRIPVYVAETHEEAMTEPQESTMYAYAERLRAQFAGSVGAAGTAADEDRAARAAQLANITFESLLESRLAYGTPDEVVTRLNYLQETLGLSGVILEPNVGGRIPLDNVLTSLRLFGHEVAPKLN